MSYSEQLVEQGQQEADELRSKAAALRAKADSLILEAERRLAEALMLERRALDLDEVLGVSAQLSLSYEDQALRGERLRAEAIRILVEKHGIGRPIHYRRWYKLLLDSGLHVFGKDPQATFLTEISRLAVVERVAGETGTYQLDPEQARARTSQRMSEAERELRRAETRFASAEDGGAGAEEAEGHVRKARQDVDAARREVRRVVKADALLIRTTLPAL
jgi:hypothetical protein